MQRYRHDPAKNLVGFVVGNVQYAVPIARVREIANPLGLVPLPHAPPSVVGVADYRGAVVAVVDLRLRFGLASAALTRKTKWIVVDVDDRATERTDGTAQHAIGRGQESGNQAPGSAATGRLVALVVDAVTEVFGTTGSEIRPAPTLGGGDDARGIAGVITHASNLVFVLDTGRMRDLADALAIPRLADGAWSPFDSPPGTP